MDLHLKGKRVLVTGASAGIGRSCARIFAEEGAEVLMAARRGDLLEKIAKELTTDCGVKARWRAIDLTQRDSAEELAGWAESDGGLDILVNNAGAVPAGDLLALDEEAWRAGWELKVFGYINLTRAVYRAMKDRGHGVIVNVIGTGGERSRPGYVAGATANAGLMAFTRTLGCGAPRDGLRVLGINPGPVVTERLETVMRKFAETSLGDGDRYLELTKDMPFGRAAHPEEIAHSVAFLASDRSSYTSGCILTIDGGIVAGE